MRLAPGLLVLLIAATASGCAAGPAAPRAAEPTAATPLEPSPVVVAQHPAPVEIVAPEQAFPASPPVAPPAETPPAEPTEMVTPAPPAPIVATYSPTADDLVLLQAATRFIEDMVIAMEGTQQDCDRMGVELEHLFNRNRGLLTQAKALKGNTARDAWFKGQAEKNLMPLVQRMMPPMTKCSSNKRVIGALQSL